MTPSATLLNGIESELVHGCREVGQGQIAVETTRPRTSPRENPPYVEDSPEGEDEALGMFYNDSSPARIVLVEMNLLELARHPVFETDLLKGIEANRDLGLRDCRVFPRSANRTVVLLVILMTDYHECFHHCGQNPQIVCDLIHKDPRYSIDNFMNPSLDESLLKFEIPILELWEDQLFSCVEWGNKILKVTT